MGRAGVALSTHSGEVIDMPEGIQSGRSPSGDPEGGTAQIPTEILEKLPESDRQRVQEFFSAAMWAAPVGNPMLAKITPEHISDMIALASRSGDLTLQIEKTPGYLA
jgi:hypothetical protein